MGYYPETKFVVSTPNKSLLPLAVYEVERGEFATEAEARVLANELAELENTSVQIHQKKWVEVSIREVWIRPK